MKIISTNIAKPVTITWNNKKITTGIYKKPVSKSIYLGKEGVHGDEVSNKKVHGGEFKACYLFAAEEYEYWKDFYPNLDWTWGMFGENLTVSGLDETEIYIGDIYKVGNALVQITQPREPCFKFGVKFGSQKVIKQFIDNGYPGTYIRILEEGTVKNGDTFKLIEKAKDSITIAQFFNLIFVKEKSQGLIELAVENDALPIDKRNKLKSLLKESLV